jgi:hypothetical protein
MYLSLCFEEQDIRTPVLWTVGSTPPYFNPLNAELTPICHLLALLGAHHILHVSRERINCGVTCVPGHTRQTLLHYSIGGKLVSVCCFVYVVCCVL